ncbi:MAG: ADOP family duplicated permease [Bryobacteraceae bacterium]|nr:ADOP family duplicated permease [Bryobacteraceae bacterium]
MLRQLRRSPVSSLAAVASLAIGIGVSLAVFTVADAALFRPLDVPLSSSLVSLYQRNPEGVYSSVSYPLYRYLAQHARSLDGLLAYARLPLNAQWPEGAERLSSEMVSANYCDVLRIAPVLGTCFRPGDVHAVLISHRLWLQRFDASPLAFGRTLVLNRQPFRIAGVLPPSFRGIVLDWGDPPDVWFPIAAHAIVPLLPLENAATHWMLAAGRLATDADAATAQAEAQTLAASFYRQHPQAAAMRYRPVLIPTAQARFWPAHRESIRHYIAVLAAAALLTLAMSCCSVANLLLSRSEQRRRDLGIRTALGAGRLRLATGLLGEALSLTVAGALGGCALAALAPRFLAWFHNPFGIPLHLDLRITAAPLLAAVALSVGVALLVALAPVRYAWRIDIATLIRTAGGGSRRRLRPTEALAGAQLAICLVAVAGAGLFLRTLDRARASDPAFQSQNALLVQLDLLSAGYDQAKGRLLQQALLDRVRALTGVASAAYVKTVPLGGMRSARDIRIDGQLANVETNIVSQGYPESAGVALLAGRDIRAGETDAVLVNEAMARRAPLGSRIEPARGGSAFTVVGVVRDGRQRSFREATNPPRVYFPLAADHQQMITLQVRTISHPVALAGAVREVVASLAPGLPLQLTTMQAHLAAALSRERLAASMLAGLSAFALLLAAIALYGVVAVAVAQRTREIGIRIALGARARQVLSAVLGRYLALTAAATASGLLGAVFLSRFVEPLLFGVSAFDPISFAAAAIVLALAALLAVLAPARRALAADPAASLRQE